MRTAALVLLLMIPLAGCGARENSTRAAVQENTDPTPERLGEIGADIANDPASAESIVADAGMTLEEFEAQVRRVTEDPELSRRYATAFHAQR